MLACVGMHSLPRWGCAALCRSRAGFAFVADAGTCFFRVTLLTDDCKSARDDVELPMLSLATCGSAHDYE